ncbi:AAA family ATPase [Caminibacter pacificus]|nr:ATP-binding protein [Campylobacterota bacterium]
MQLPKKILDRKVKLSFKNTLITGPKRVGKTFLVFNFLKNFKGKYKYIDFSDHREKDLDFSGVDLVVLDNYDFQIPIPDKTTFIISNKNIEIEGFEKIELGGLDFEEFFAFDNTTNINQTFDRFLRLGNFPKLFSEEYFKDEYLKETFELLPYNKKILAFFFAHLGEKFTLYQIYQILKKEMKLSKDSFYKETNELLKNKIIFEVNKFESPKSPKKFFAYNFAFKSIMTNRKNPLHIFENIIFLELNKKEVYYKDTLSFYLPEEKRGILVLPFANEEIAQEKLKKVTDVEKVDIITISNEFEITNDKFEVEVTPFWRWRFAE